MAKGYGQKRYLRTVIGRIERDDPELKNVVLNGFNIVDAKLATLTMALVNNTHVERLHLDGNQISDEGARLIAYVLHQNSTLAYLSLNDNGITSAGVETLAAALYQNATLFELRLSNNRVGNRGGKSLSRMLRAHNSSLAVHLGGNPMSPKVMNRVDARCLSGPIPVKADGDHDRRYSRNGSSASTASGVTAGTVGRDDATVDTARARGGRRRDQEPPNDRPARRSQQQPVGHASDDEQENELDMSALESDFYLQDSGARKYILGCSAEDLSSNSLVGSSAAWRTMSSSWNDLTNNLAEYMVKVNRSRIEAEERCMDEVGGADDDLSVASEDPTEEECSRAKLEKTRRELPRKWSVLKMKLSRGRAKVGVADLSESTNSIHSFDDY
mmetsp:Transcript_38474/g.86674  ORF Transcript_38474/g.86674 Transcript_38474/m.86674 type:complete len:386 (-) Transcript_38474:99-1256(-)